MKGKFLFKYLNFKYPDKNKYFLTSLPHIHKHNNKVYHSDQASNRSNYN